MFVHVVKSSLRDSKNLVERAHQEEHRVSEVHTLKTVNVCDQCVVEDSTVHISESEKEFIKKDVVSCNK